MTEREPPLDALPPSGEERIVRAAIWWQNAVWSVEKPGRHGDVIRLMAARPDHDLAHTHSQGFLTSEGRYVGRETAFQIATAAGQIIKKTGNPGDTTLYSEDVW